MEYIGTVKKQTSIVELLKTEILSGNIPGGMEMTQKELAESLGVSRMPVREALIILEYQGLIERLTNNHVRVAEFGDDCFRNIFDVCMRLELQALKDRNREWKSIAGQTDKHLTELDIHRQIADVMSNSFLKKTLETILDIYVDHAVNCFNYDAEKGRALLYMAVDAQNEEEQQKYLQNYFALLADAAENAQERE